MSETIELPVVMFGARTINSGPRDLNTGKYVRPGYRYDLRVLQNAVPYCEGMPLCVNHPRFSLFEESPFDDRYREYVRDKTFGYIKHPSIRNNRLVGTAVIDLERLAELSPDLHGRIKGGDVIEVSLGWVHIRAIKFHDENIVRHAYPHHLGVLEGHGQGRCPVSEGFGLGHRKELCNAER